ncbi:MAG TPA: hypothetical protein VIC25_11170 [Caulobacteraceae bacterium]|jgi:hypothetical protein
MSHSKVDGRWAGRIGALGALWLMGTLGCVAAVAAARADEAAVAATCGMRLSAPVLAKWSELGGQSGILGCPTANETPGSTSPQGSKADEADFIGGMILWHASGPHAGRTFAVSGCIWRLYFSYGGPSGWLGLPITEPANFPDGQRQTFEGGLITYWRSPNQCEAERSEATTATAVAAATATSPLDAYDDPARGDHLALASASVARAAATAHYQRSETLARVFDAAGPGEAPLKLFWNEDRGDHLATATDEGERNALAEGYIFEASQGFVWTEPHPGAVALRQYREPTSGHHWLTAGPAGEAAAKAAGFVFVRVEGYAPPP